MDNLNEEIRAACFDLSVHLMWEKDEMTLDKIERSMAELQSMTEEFYKSALFYLENIESLEGKPEIIVNAIKYIDNIHSFPPLRGNTIWFDYTLGAVVELACPNGRLNKNNLDFLKDIENGIADYRKNVNT
jgi:hypothetical protein